MATLIALIPLIEPRTFNRVERDAKFESEDAELLCGSGMARLAEVSDEASEEETETPSGEAPEWTKKMPPEDYLKQYPDGPAAGLARKVLAAKEAGASTSEVS